MKTLIALTLVLAPAYCAAATAISLELEPAKTDISFTLHDPLHTVHGTFKLKRGIIYFDPDSGKSSGEIVVDVASGESGSGARDKRMHKDVLESQKYPDALFTPDHVDGKLPAEGSGQMDVHGVFKIHGGDHELTLHFQVERSGGQYNATAHFQIPYVQWGMKDPSNFLLKVDKTVDMEIKTAIARMISSSL
jgi:polyisoprenoid-binding protein YceI